MKRDGIRNLLKLKQIKMFVSSIIKLSENKMSLNITHLHVGKYGDCAHIYLEWFQTRSVV
jgi:hypothetical protein